MGLNPTFTLADIRNVPPRADGWFNLLRSLGLRDGSYDPNLRLSLGDVALSNGAPDALWCVRCLDWSDVDVRRAVIAGAVMPAVKRASVHTTDARVHDCIAAIESWCAGDDSVDLLAAAAASAAADAADAAAADAAWAADAAADAVDTANVWADAERDDILAAFPPLVLTKEP